MQFFYEQRKKRITALRGGLEWEMHLHNDIEIVYMRRGTCDASVDGEKYELSPGDCLVVFPNRIHDYRNGIDDLADVLIVDPGTLAEYSGILSKRMPVNPYIPKASDEIKNLFELIYDTDGKFTDSIRFGYCNAVVGLLFENMEFKDIGKTDIKIIQGILDYCTSHYNESITVSTVAENLGLSESYVSHVFNDRLNIGFISYINSMRINQAMRLIDEGKLSNTEIAFETGFGTIRTFNRAFSAHMGCTPSDYKKGAKKDE